MMLERVAIRYRNGNWLLHAPVYRIIRKEGNKMSQAKVDKYKNYKKNRRENIKKEKRKVLAGKIAAWAVVVLIIAGVGTAGGVSAYNSYQAKLAALPTYGSTSFILSDYVGIQAQEDAADQEETGSEAESEAQTEEDASAEETTEAETGSQAESASAEETVSETK